MRDADFNIDTDAHSDADTDSHPDKHVHQVNGDGLVDETDIEPIAPAIFGAQ